MCVGVAAGLRATMPPSAKWVALLAAAALFVPAVLARSRGPASVRLAKPNVPLLLAAAFCGGLAPGLEAGSRARAACVAEISNGDPVEIQGWLAAPLGGSRRRTVRATLLDPVLRWEGRSCRLSELEVRLRASDHRAPAGAAVRVRGTWSAYGRPGAWPRRATRHGTIRGEAEAAPDGAERAGKLGVLRSLRASAIARLEGRLPADVGPAAVAIILANRDQLDSDTKRSFAEAGLAHLLAISGLHVGILAAVALALLGPLLPGAYRFPIAAVLVLGYVLLIGAPPAAVRAALLFAGYAASRMRGSPVRLMDLLGAAAAVAVLADPLILVEPGFQLSFAGFGGLMLGDSVVRRLRTMRDWHGSAARPGRIRRGFHGLLRSLGASGGAFVLTAPIAAWHFQRVAPVAVLSSLPGSPLIALALVALAGVLILPSPVADLLAAAAAVLLRALFGLVDLLGRVPLGHGVVGRPGLTEWVIFGSGLVSIGILVAGRSAWRAVPPLGLVGALILAGPAIRSWQRHDRTLVCTLDVGQGDAAVVRTRRGHWLVLDAGPRFGSWDAGKRVVLPFLLARGAREIDVFALSHPDLDHVGGAVALLDRFRVRRLLGVGRPVPSKHYREYLEVAVREEAEWLPARPGARLRLDEVELLVLGPQREESRAPIRANDASLVIRLTVDGSFAYVNAGDAPAAEERRTLDRWPIDSLRADVLKVSHHGSKNSSDVGWLTAVAPELAIISAGAANRYGHPHPMTLARLDSAGIPAVWRTDRDGTACVTVDRSGRWWVERG